MSSVSVDDRTTKAKIRDAAIECFAEVGTAGTTARSVAAKAGVSAGSVIHHFGSMDALRVACDTHVVAFVRERKTEAMGQGAGVDPMAAMRESSSGPPVLAYLARTMTDGSPHVTELVAEMIDDAVTYMGAGAESGLLNPLEDPRGCAAILTVWSLGALVLHEQVKAILGVDLLSPDLASDPRYVSAYMAPAFELLSGGMVNEAAAARIKSSLSDASQEGH